MASRVDMPRLGWAMEEGTLVEWRKRPGDRVEPGDIVCVIEGEKAEQEVESFDGGTLHIPPGSPAPGVRVPVGTLLAWILAPGEAPPSEAVEVVPAVSLQASATGPVPAAAGSRPSGPAAGPRQPGTGPVASPRARRVARELGVDWTALRGSGLTGRIVERDVRRAAPAGLPAGVSPAAAAPAPAGPLKGARRVIAERMAESARTVAPVTLHTDADATSLVRLRRDLAADLAGAGPAPSYTDLFVKLVAVTLEAHPALNASLLERGLVQHPEAHVAFAVDTERGLMAPVIRGARGKSLQAISRESAALVEAARAGRLSPDALRGGTFTVTNLGMYDVDAFTPIVNLPECAILGIGRIVARPVVVDEASEEVAVRRMVTLSLTFDHRVVDGGPAARFLQAVRRHVERPGLWLTA